MRVLFAGLLIAQVASSLSAMSAPAHRASHSSAPGKQSEREPLLSWPRLDLQDHMRRRADEMARR